MEPVSAELKQKLQSVGIITCEFYFLDNPTRNKNLRGMRKDIETLPPISEKAIKGDALSHQAMSVITYPSRYHLLILHSVSETSNPQNK